MHQVTSISAAGSMSPELLTASEINLLRSLDIEEKLKLLQSLDDEEATFLDHLWSFWARDNQLEPPGDWTTWLILAGRGFGKTRTGAETVNKWAEQGLYPRIALIAEDPNEAREVMIEGESGILSCAPPWFLPQYEPSKKRVTWPNGVRGFVYSSEDPESLRGPQFHAGWLDELAKWRYAQETWDNFQFGLRLGRKPRQIITTTPRPTKLLKMVLKRRDTFLTGGSTYENLENLSPAFQEAVVSRYEGTRLGRQELDAELLEDNPYALWHLDNIHEFRVDWPEVELRRTVIAVDPPASSGEDADECGIIGCALGADNRGYVMDDYSTQGDKPEQWARRALDLYEELQADAIVAEVNNGGDMVESVINTVAEGQVKVIKVHASKGKTARAEPVSALYSKGRVSHVGILARLEDQMTDFTSDFDRKKMGYSPDRVDALVWGLTELMLDKQGGTPRVRTI